jgi:hypothetical protein
MARPNTKLIQYIRKTAQSLKEGASYSWGNLGKCNCGHLIQTITELSPGDIHQKALHPTGEWTELANDYCPTSGLEMNSMIESLLNVGVELDDIKFLEHLEDVNVLKRLPNEKRYLQRNNREDLILYLEEWANYLEENLSDKILFIEPKYVKLEEKVFC